MKVVELTTDLKMRAKTLEDLQKRRFVAVSVDNETDDIQYHRSNMGIQEAIVLLEAAKLVLLNQLYEGII